jgi:xanthine dehydrogenase YagT iron-sulfur-binding subunit
MSDLRDRPSPDPTDDGLTRRQFVTGAAVAAGAAAFPATGGEVFAAGEAPPVTPAPAGDAVAVKLQVNGRPHDLNIDSRASLLDTLRETLGLTGTKKGCDHGQCGACTVHIDGRRVLSCLTLTATCGGCEVTTIEGLASGDELHPVQKAFIEHDAFQCGYCTPGQIMSAVALIKEGRANTEDEVRESMSGNLCRCGAYPGICKAVLDAKQKMFGFRL